MNRIAEITITYSPVFKKEERFKITHSSDAATYFREVWSPKMEHIEEVYLMLLNRSNEVLGFMKVSQGGFNSSVVDPKVIFQAALKGNASGLIIAHNHPSGGLKPSEQDIRLTKRIKEGAKILELSFLDHLIMSQEGYYSFADEGLL